MGEETKAEKILLLDTCGETGSVALSVGDRIVAEVLLPERGASTAVLGTVAAMLGEAGLRVADLTGVGVVNGPGSFTGVRVGLAVAKGLCEAANVPAAAVSRLAVLAGKSGLTEGYAVLRAGRDQLFVREIGNGKGRESLVEVRSFLQSADGAPLVYAEESQGPMLMEAGEARLLALSARDAIGLVRARLQDGGDDLSAVDANYVRDEDAIYARQRAME